MAHGSPLSPRTEETAVTTNRTRDTERQGYAWAGGLIGILAGLGATLGLLLAGGEGIALGAAFGAAAGVLAAAVLGVSSSRR